MGVNNIGSSEFIANWEKASGNSIKVAQVDGLWTVEESTGDLFTFVGSQWISRGKSADSIVESSETKEEAVDNLNKSEEALEREKAETEAKIKQIEEQIQKLKEEVEAAVAKATEKMTKMADEKKENTNKLCLGLANKLSKGEITKEEFNSQLAAGLTDLGFDAQFQSNLFTLLEANNKISLIEFLANEIGMLKDKLKGIDQQIQAAQAARKSCDPIGFELNGVKYDFFVDKDKNGLLSNENEFLGAGENWDEMTALDTDGSDHITRAEMEAAGLMVAVTTPDGTQKIMRAVDLFGEEDVINLLTYESGANADQNVAGFDAAGGKNQLLGTFGLTFRGEEVTGYQTLDDVDWLKQNYKFSDASVGAGAITRGEDGKVVNKNANISAEHAEMIQKLREMVQSAMEQLGFTKEAIEAFDEASYKCAQADKELIMSQIDAKAKEEVDAQEAEKAKAEEAKAAEEADAEEDPLKKKPEEESEI